MIGTCLYVRGTIAQSHRLQSRSVSLPAFVVAVRPPNESQQAGAREGEAVASHVFA